MFYKATEKDKETIKTNLNKAINHNKKAIEIWGVIAKNIPNYKVIDGRLVNKINEKLAEKYGTHEVERYGTNGYYMETVGNVNLWLNTTYSKVLKFNLNNGTNDNEDLWLRDETPQELTGIIEQKVNCLKESIEENETQLEKLDENFERYNRLVEEIKDFEDNTNYIVRDNLKTS